MMLVAVIGTLIGALLFIVAVGAAFTGFTPALLVAVGAYPVAAALLARLRPVPTWLPAAALVALPMPVAVQFGVALLFEEGVLAALIWPCGLIAVFFLSWFGAWLQRRFSERRPPG